jgi:hypothetical protein
MELTSIAEEHDGVSSLIAAVPAHRGNRFAPGVNQAVSERGARAPAGPLPTPPTNPHLTRGAVRTYIS